MDAARRAAPAVLALTLAGCGGRVADPPRIEPWTTIGSATLGMSPRAVESFYAGRRRARLLSTRNGQLVDRRTYSVPGGALTVEFVERRARALATTSARYRLPDGTRVGERLIGRPCGRPKTVACWRDFSYDACTGLMIGGRSDTTAYLRLAARTVDPSVLKSRGYAIREIGFGVPAVLSHCF